MKPKKGIVTVLLFSLSMVGCLSSNNNPNTAPSTKVDFNAADFDADSATIDNTFLSMEPGTMSIYQGMTDEGMERIEISISHETKFVAGIKSAIMVDRAYIDNELVEKTFDWFAQDRNGNVWYMGEASNDYENGVLVSTAGSWEAGMDVVGNGNIAEAGV